MLKKRYIKVSIGKDNNKLIFESEMRRHTMRIDFDIDKNANSVLYGMNKANIELYNLNDESYDSILAHERYIIVEAGYEGEGSVIFNGRISNVLRIKKNATDTDIIINLLCVSGLKNLGEYVYTADFSKEAENSSLLEIENFVGNLFNDIKIVENGIKVDVPDFNVIFVPKLDGRKITGYVRPQAYDGSLLDILKELGSQFAFTFNIEENQVIVRPREVAPTFDIRPETGLLGIPEITEKGIDLRLFLNPQIEAGTGFNLTSEFANFKLGALEFLDRITTGNAKVNVRNVNEFGRYQGTYRILKVKHKGSTFSNEWMTSIESQNYIV
jgi:hypothetical protein